MNDLIKNCSFRNAEIKDIPFIIETIIEAEKSGSNVIPTCKIFGLTEDEYKNILVEILAENYEDYDYHLSGYIVAEYEGVVIGALGSWIEKLNGLPSSVIKGNILIPYLDENKITMLRESTKHVREFIFKRTDHAVQLEYGYVKEEFRRKGVFTRIVLEHIKRAKTKYSDAEMVETTLMKANFKSFDCYMKLDFDLVEEKKTINQSLINIYRHDTKVLIRASGEKFTNLLNLI